MASAILHIKDSYYFEVPKFLWRAQFDAAGNPFPDWLIKLDAGYLIHQANSPEYYKHIQKITGDATPAQEVLVEQYEHWLHEHKGHSHPNAGKPLARYLEEAPGEFPQLFRQKIGRLTATDIKESKAKAAGEKAKQTKTTEPTKETEAFAKTWDSRDLVINTIYTDYKAADYKNWSKEKVETYNKELHGKIMVPQPLGELKNLYEPSSGFCISKFMVIELVVATIIAFIFIRLAGRIRTGDRPKGRVWNFFEAMLLFVRDEVARPAIGAKEAGKFVPLLWTIFFFVLGCNLMGMLPWAGAPTGAFAVTLALACITLGTGFVFGVIKFGPLGYWMNQIPAMDLPGPLAIVLKPMIFVIEVVGMFIKHSILGVRLLANMVAGHVVLLGIMGIAFSLEGAASEMWYLSAGISVVSATLFSCLELFVAFLQAYIFTFLSALFIGAAVHHH